MATKKEGGKNRKFGRNKVYAARYQLENRLAKNKARRLARHVKRMAKKRKAA